MRHTKVPLYDRCATLLVRGGASADQAALDHCLLSFVTVLSTKHEDAIMFIAQSPSFLPELLDKLFKDVRTLWDADGQTASDPTRAVLAAAVERLSASVHLYYFLTCAPGSTLKSSTFFAQSAYGGLHDRFTVAFGTLSFAGLPDWAEGTQEGRTLAGLGFLASEICEDISPEEADQIEDCFGEPEESEEAEGEEEGAMSDDEDVLRAAEADRSQG